VPLSLITPIGSDFIKNWPAQNAVNCDSIDAYAGQCLPSQTLLTYTPQLIGATTNPVFGTGGFIHGYVYRIFDSIYTWGELRFGTAAINVGSGNWSITLPEAANVSTPGDLNVGRGHTLGNALAIDDSSGTKEPLTLQLITSTEMRLLTRMTTGLASSVVGSTIPFAWAIQDGILWNARYKRAP
jgi:hypothetical protein